MIVMTKFKLSNISSDLEILWNQIKFEHLVAGITGGVASTLSLHPLDVIKIRFAVNDGHHQTPQYSSIRNAFATIYQQEGFKGLYRGVIPNVIGAGVSWGCYFLFYNSIKTYVQQGNADKVLGPAYHLLAASQAGVMTLFITNPIWVVKTRLCLQYNDKDARYKGMIDALIKIYKINGFKGYYKGIVPGIFGVSHGAVQFMVYEELKNRYNTHNGTSISTKLSSSEYLCFAGISKIIAVSTTYPYQVVRARLQNQYYNYNGTYDCVKKTWIGEGWRGFYKGLASNLIKVTPASVITFLTYEKILQFLIK